MSRREETDARLDLRGERAGNAFSDFCFAWLDTGREIAFGSTELILRTADDLAAASCSSGRSRAIRRGRYRRDVVEVERR